MLVLALSGLVYSTKTSQGLASASCGRGVNAPGELRLAQHLAQDTASMLARDCSDKRRGPKSSQSSVQVRNPPSRLRQPDIP